MYCQSHCNTSGRPFLGHAYPLSEEPALLSRTASPMWLLANTTAPFSPGSASSNAFGDASAKGPDQPRQCKSWTLWTQIDQDETDAEIRRKVMKELVHSWMDRLQLISVIATFFAATEAQLLGFVMPDDGERPTRIQQAANASLVGALVIHLCAAIISFLAAFFLIRYRLREAKREERKVEAGGETTTTTTQSSQESQNHIWSADPHLEQVGPFRRGPPTRLLEHCHTLCMWLAAVGFVLALAGVLCYSWSRLPRSASIFATTIMGVCWAATLAAVFLLP
ncbi:uncharacterized protein LAESUDRAFT_737497 [Laetiporus sulphureus 93-53]|uniref:Transmembrane protein n=1 Tax=Laetiporus sulphureus 93-53 TaxID=1314785 RepID=A0A165DPI6_9APHY|nr:uncharacterized protein LAESUDRAFT_737497 [Laetiporus sulphureus 93-53]KZT05336.1 hypothetical protein LAESUDRAFT_737497 [Laetiporus sulphureus 93-53]